MSCKPICRLCDKFVISTAVAYTGGNLQITIPAGAYFNTKYCIVVAQDIPAETVISAPVVIQVGEGTQLYPLVKCNCRPVLAASLRSRTRYSVCVETTSTSGVFKLLGRPCCAPENQLQSINGTAPTA